MLFRSREKRSWQIFLIINLITQGALNIWINGLFPMQSYLFIGLLFLEILILIVESIVVLSSIKEYRKGRKFLFVITANFLSLVAGGYILTILPFWYMVENIDYRNSPRWKILMELITWFWVEKSHIRRFNSTQNFLL